MIRTTRVRPGTGPVRIPGCTTAPGQALGDVDATVWPVLSGAGFAAATLLGVVVLRHGRSWPGLSGRYEAPSRRVDDDPWKALDEGRDPTL